jgi:hypothetical protein
MLSPMHRAVARRPNGRATLPAGVALLVAALLLPVSGRPADDDRRSQVDAALLHVPRATGTWWFQGRTGTLELTFHQGAVTGAASGAWLTDVGRQQRIVRGAVKGIVAHHRVRFLATMRPKTRGPEERWRFAGTIDPARGWAEGTVGGTGSWQVSFSPITDWSEYAARAFSEAVDSIVADREPPTQSRHYLARRTQLELYASWLISGSAATARESPAASAQRAVALGDMTRQQVAILRLVWGHAERAPEALRTCREALADERLCAEEQVRLWANPNFGSSLARDARPLRERLRARAGIGRGLLSGGSQAPASMPDRPAAPAGAFFRRAAGNAR